MGRYLNYLLIGGFTDKKKKLSKDWAILGKLTLEFCYRTSGYFFCC